MDYRMNNLKINRYLKEKEINLDAETLIKNEKQKLAVICYAKNENDEFLLLERFKEPFAGKLAAPGGKTDYEEHIEDSVRREFLEETGIILNDLKLKLITSEVGPVNYNWILFVYTSDIKKQPLIDSDEGILKWVKKDEMIEDNITSIDKQLIEHIFDEKIKYINIEYKNSEDFKIKNIKNLV